MLCGVSIFWDIVVECGIGRLWAIGTAHAEEIKSGMKDGEISKIETSFKRKGEGYVAYPKGQAQKIYFG